jgi:hypothetical protein
MNSDQDNSSNALYNRLLSWLLDDAASPTADVSNLGEPDEEGAREPEESMAASSFIPHPSEAVDLEMDELEPLESEDLDFVPYSLGEAASCRQPLDLGETPTMQNRFQRLMKARLQLEIENRPPLFPWETEINEYKSEAVEVLPLRMPAIHLWMPQLAQLSLPAPMPEKILAQLLKACTEAMQSSLQQGAKMVQAVKTLFPEQPETVNQLAGLVMMYPSRSAQEKRLFTSGYEEATSEQQMALSLLAAREILNALTLAVSSDRPQVERQWQTSAGTITVQAEYQFQGNLRQVRVQSKLPRGGSLTLQTPQASATAQRAYPGYLSVESFDLLPNQAYPLEIRLAELGQQPLVLAIALEN